METAIIIIALAAFFYLSRRITIYPVLQDFKDLFSEGGLTDVVDENQHKHFGLSALIILALIGVGSYIPQLQLESFNIPLMIFCAYLAGWGINFAREWYYGKKGNPFSFRDIRYGAYGATIGGLIGLVLFV